MSSTSHSDAESMDVELRRAEGGLSSEIVDSAESSDTNQKTSNSPLFTAVFMGLVGIVLVAACSLTLYFTVFATSDTHSFEIVHVDSSTKSIDEMNAYITNLQSNFDSSPDEYGAYSDMAPEWAPMFSGYEPEEVKQALEDKFPKLAGIDSDHYIISTDVFSQDKDANWGLLHANVRGYPEQTILLSPDQLQNVLLAEEVEVDDINTPSSGSTRTFNWDEAMTAVYHSQICYCNEGTYLSRNYDGELSGFTPTYRIFNDRLDTAGYIGYHSSEQTIHVNFRGSVTLTNWITNLDMSHESYPRCDGCRLHSGFYEAALAVFADVLAEVLRLRSLNPSFKVIVTGHSLGGALAHITALELEANGISNLELYTFGSPRVTNTEMAAYSTQKLPTASRVTHSKDIVVRLPGSVFFTHMAGEWHEPNGRGVRVVECFGYEDSSCSTRYIFTSILDHLKYLGVEMGPFGCPN